jgi:hypothetical protein
MCRQRITTILAVILARVHDGKSRKSIILKARRVDLTRLGFAAVTIRKSRDEGGSASESIAALPPWLIAATTGILGAAGYGLVDWIAPAKVEWSFPARLVVLTIAGTVLLFLVLVLLHLRVWLRNRTHVAFGVLWNSGKQPICASCGGPLSLDGMVSFKCPRCQIYIHPHDEDGLSLLATDALARIKGKHPAP